MTDTTKEMLKDFMTIKDLIIEIMSTYQMSPAQAIMILGWVRDEISTGAKIQIEDELGLTE